MRVALLVAVATGLVAAQEPAPGPAAGAFFDVAHYAVSLDLDPARGSITGKERIELMVQEATVFPDWNRSSADDRAVAYQKGALTLHELRELLGDAMFWTAVRTYTRAHAGQPVVSSDLQRAFEQSSGRDLRAFFDQRVHPR